MKTNLFFISCIILLGLSTCKKDKEEGTMIQVVEYGTKKPIPNARIAIQKSGQGWFGVPITVGEIYADNEGRALIKNTFTDDRVGAIQIYTDGRPYFDGDVVFQSAQFSDFREKPLIELYPIAYVRLQADWSVFEGEFDYVTNSRLPGCMPVDCNFLFNANTTLPTPPLRVYGNRMENKVLLTGTRPDGSAISFYSEEVYSPAFDTTIYILRR
jgi:hypothetical protein